MVLYARGSVGCVVYTRRHKARPMRVLLFPLFFFLVAGDSSGGG